MFRDLIFLRIVFSHIVLVRTPIQRFTLIIILLLTYQTYSYSIPEYSLNFDKNLSPNCGAENILTLHRAVYEIGKFVKYPVFVNKCLNDHKTVGISMRLAQSILINNIIDGFLTLSQHEIFGHGAWLRNYDFEKTKYELHLFPPFGDGHGLTWLGIKGTDTYISQSEWVFFNTSGFNANTFLSENILEKWCTRKELHYREANLYLFSTLDVIWYAFRNYHRTNMGLDIERYLGIMNNGSYGKSITKKSIYTTALFMLLDPYVILSLKSIFYDYLINNKHRLLIKNSFFYPSIKLYLTPFGLDNKIIFPITVKNNLLLFYIRGNVLDILENYGVGFNYRYDFDIIKLGFQFDYWNQTGKSPNTMKQFSGINVSQEVLVNSFIIPAVFLKFLVGYKSYGFIPGRQLQKTPYLSTGISIFLSESK